MLKNLIQNFITLTDKLKDLYLLIFRITLAYGFYIPAKNKWSDIYAIADWFTSMNIPLPLLNAYMAAGTEAAGVALLTLGLATRIISIPLMFVMLVAIATVHYKNGFSCGDNGFEVPYYYLIMLFALTTSGPGRLSLDHLIHKRFK